MDERLKEIRTFLHLSQDSFGSRIGMTGGGVSLLEKGKRNFTDQVIKSVCREFSVDYMWLTTGDGEMFVENDSDMMDVIDRIMVGENEFHKNLFKTFASLDESELVSLESIIDKFLDIKKGG